MCNLLNMVSCFSRRGKKKWSLCYGVSREFDARILVVDLSGRRFCYGPIAKAWVFVSSPNAPKYIRVVRLKKRPIKLYGGVRM